MANNWKLSSLFCFLSAIILQLQCKSQAGLLSWNGISLIRRISISQIDGRSATKSNTGISVPLGVSPLDEKLLICVDGESWANK